MFYRFSKWLHDRREHCGYEKVDSIYLKQGLYFCEHCQEFRHTKPRLADWAINEVIS